MCACVSVCAMACWSAMCVAPTRLYVDSARSNHGTRAVYKTRDLFSLTHSLSLILLSLLFLLFLPRSRCLRLRHKQVFFDDTFLSFWPESFQLYVANSERNLNGKPQCRRASDRLSRPSSQRREKLRRFAAMRKKIGAEKREAATRVRSGERRT